MEGILGRFFVGCFSEDYAKLSLICVHEAHGNNKSGGRGKIIKSAKNEGWAKL